MKDILIFKVNHVLRDEEDWDTMYDNIKAQMENGVVILPPTVDFVTHIPGNAEKEYAEIVTKALTNALE
jgi:hypothetical protein